MNLDERIRNALCSSVRPANATTGYQAVQARLHPASRQRRNGLRVAVFASMAVILVAAMTIGGFMAVRNLARPAFVLAITDDTAVGPHAGSGQWVRLPLATSERGPVERLVMDPSNPAILYVSTSEGLFKSIDGAGSWKQLPTIPPTDLGGVRLVIDPNSPSTIYVAYTSVAQADNAVTTHLLRSDDGGLTWTDLTEAGAPRMGGDMWLATTFGTKATLSTIYLYDDTGYVWRSTDRGTTWTRLSSDEGQRAFSRADIHSPRPRPAASQEAVDAFVASSGDDIHFTDPDTGVVVSIDPDAIVVDPVHPSNFYVATLDGVYRSNDSGRSWRKAITGLGLVDRTVSSVLVDPTTPLTLYATTKAGIYRSTNGGTEWTPILRGEGSVVLAPSTPSRLYAWTDAGLFRSDDSGTNWAQLNGAGLPGKDRTGIFGRLALVLADQPDTLFAVSESAVWSPFYLYRSTDAGNSWQKMDLQLGGILAATSDFFYRGVVADPQHASTLYVVIGSSNVHAYHVSKSTDDGATWTDLVPSEWDAPVVSLSLDPHNPDTVWAIQNGLSDEEHSTVRRSIDGGANWEKVKLDGRAERIMSLVFDPHAVGTLYAYTGGTSFWDGTLHRSTDGGTTWVNIGENMPSWLDTASLVPDSAPGGALYAATGDGLYKWVPYGD